MQEINYQQEVVSRINKIEALGDIKMSELLFDMLEDKPNCENTAKDVYEIAIRYIHHLKNTIS